MAVIKQRTCKDRAMYLTNTPKRSGAERCHRHLAAALQHIVIQGLLPGLEHGQGPQAVPQQCGVNPQPCLNLQSIILVVMFPLQLHLTQAELVVCRIC